MNWRKILKSTGLAVAVLALVGMIGVYRVFRDIYPPLEAILIVENMAAGSPVEVVELTYDGRLLYRSPHFLHIKVFPNLKPSRDHVEVNLKIKRPDAPKSETYAFIAEQGEYAERCAFQIRIEMTSARMSKCVWFE